MVVAAWLTAHRLRHWWIAVGSIAAIAAAGVSAALVAGAAAERTGSAYDRYADRAALADVLVNPVTFTAEADAVIRSLPGVRSAVSAAGFSATLDDGAPRPRSRIDADPTAMVVFGSTDGRYVDVDRPALAAGRLATGRAEAVASVEAAAAFGLDVGDELTIAFWSSRDDPRNDVVPVDPDEVVAPAGVERLTVVGVATLPDEVLPDEVFPRRRVLVSPDVAARYDCVPPAPPRDADFEDAAFALFPEGCSAVYRFYALHVDGGPRAVGAALDAYVRATAALNAALPPSMFDEGGYYLVASTRQQEEAKVARSTGPTVVALLALAGVATLVTLAIVWLAVARELRRAAPDVLQWWQLGVGVGARLVAAATPAVLAVAVGSTLGLGVAWWASALGPVGNVRSVEPAPVRGLAGPVVLGGAGLAVVLAAGVVVLAGSTDRRARPRHRPRRRPSSLARLAGWTGRPAVAEGIRAALGRRDGGLVLASSAVALGTFTAAVVFGASLGRLTSAPATYGWPWDLGAMIGLGYGGLDLDAAEQALTDRDDIASFTALGFTNSITVAGEPVIAVVGFDHRSKVDLPVVAGRLPGRPDEVALGSRTAADLGIGVGDEVALDGDVIEPLTARVTGLVVLPPLGPLESDHAAPGTGILLPARLGTGLLFENAAFLGVEVAPGADPAAVRADLERDVASWSYGGFAPHVYDAPVRPPEIVDAASARVVPLLAGLLLVASASVGLAVSAAVSTRTRRRDLAVLRALGFEGAQLRRSVVVQQLVVAVGAVVVGLPLGVAAGRVAWHAFADRLGVVPTSVVPLDAVAATAAGALAVALLAALGPGLAASRGHPAPVLRRE